MRAPHLADCAGGIGRRRIGAGAAALLVACTAPPVREEPNPTPPGSGDLAGTGSGDSIGDRGSDVPHDPVIVRPDQLLLDGDAVVDALIAGYAETDGSGGLLHLTLRPCRVQQAEPETSLEADSPDACRDLNRRTLTDRRQIVLRLPSGDWEIEVHNLDVPWELGFWLRPELDPETAIVSSGGIPTGTSLRYSAHLDPGRYVYSCPLNPTPDYTLLVE